MCLNEHLEHDWRTDGPSSTPARWGWRVIVSKRLGSRYRSGRSLDWLKFKNPGAPAVKREAEEVIHRSYFCRTDGPQGCRSWLGLQGGARSIGLAGSFHVLALIVWRVSGRAFQLRFFLAAFRLRPDVIRVVLVLSVALFVSLACLPLRVFLVADLLLSGVLSPDMAGDSGLCFLSVMGGSYRTWKQQEGRACAL